MPDRPEFRIENVRETQNAALRRQAVERWLEDGTLRAGEAARRADELLLVATHGPGEGVAGMVTTYLETAGRFGLPLWHMRAYVTPEFRRHEIGLRMLLETLAFHRRQFASGADTRGLGLYMEIENPHIKRYRNEACWPKTGLAFVGCNARGDHCRVAWFDGARLDQVPPG